MSDFEKMMFGDDNAPKGGTPSFLDDTEPSFLSGPAGGGKKGAPSFLSDMSPDSSKKQEGKPSPQTISSAEKLDLVGETGVHWVLERVKILGKGSFGCATLYKQLDTKTKANAKWRSTVVVKDINVQTMVDRTEEIKNIENEVKVLKCCDGHPSCTQFVDYIDQSSSSKLMYIFLEFCGGGDLGHIIEAHKNAHKMVNETFVASVLLQVSMGLYYMHNSKGILHRDMKPENVFLLEDKVTCRIGDFGISAILDRIGGSAKMACGSPFYMAPELLQESKYNYAVDVWSLGVMLYELISLEKPFYSTNLGALTTQIIQGKCVPLRERPGVAQSFSQELTDLVMSMLTVDAAVRPTMRRVIRSNYLKTHLFCVPQDVLQHPMYVEAFGADEIKTQITKCVYKGCGGNPAQKGNTAATNQQEEYEDDFED